MNDINSVTEVQLRDIVLRDHVWAQIDPAAPPDKTRCAREVRIGKFRLDLVASNAAGGITIIELKVCASKDTLAQLLLYPHAFRSSLQKLGLQRVPDLRMALVTTFLDKGVVDLVRDLQRRYPISLRVCVKERESYLLKEPEGAPDSQVWDQATEGSATDVSVHEDRLLVKGKEIWRWR